MKVKELIEILQKYNPDDEVTVSTEGVVVPVTNVDDNGWKNNVTISGD